MSIKMQAPSVFKELPVCQNLDIALQRQRSGDDLIAERQRLRQLLDLAADADKQAGALAHGQQQWLEIGMAWRCVRRCCWTSDANVAGDTPGRRTHQSLNRDG